MNISSITAVRYLIESDKYDFDMTKWVSHRCGTAACIGGHASILHKEMVGATFLGGEDQARAFLGLSRQQSEYLFYGNGHPYLRGYDLNHIDRDMAIYQLRYMEENLVMIEWERCAAAVAAQRAAR